MREAIKKMCIGGRCAVDKEVRLRVIKAGRAGDGRQRYAVSIRFANDSWKKISDTEYVTVEFDRDEKRLYFVTGNRINGFKLSDNGHCKSIGFSVQDKQEWAIYENEYNLLKDTNSGDYYIDLRESK